MKKFNKKLVLKKKTVSNLNDSMQVGVRGGAVRTVGYCDSDFCDISNRSCVTCYTCDCPPVSDGCVSDACVSDGCGGGMSLPTGNPCRDWC
ncbi:MAG: hypothetical protein GY765_02730, partial [bacterium]|nr:hypothetical protein [bacterium]